MKIFLNLGDWRRHVSELNIDNGPDLTLSDAQTSAKYMAKEKLLMNECSFIV